MYRGPSPFSAWDGISTNAPWTDEAFIIPDGTLQVGENELAVTVLDPAAEPGEPPFVLLAEASIDAG